MPNAAFTLVQNDLIVLEQWLKYYVNIFETIIVIGNGTKEEYGELEDLKKQYKFKFERVTYAGNSDLTLSIVKAQQVKLLKKHKWVLYSDCDEFVVADPAMYKDLPQFMREFKKDKVYCIAYNVLQMPDEPDIDYSKPYLYQRKYWAKDNRYNKPLLAKSPINWAPGCHREIDIPDIESKKKESEGLLMLHTKYADLVGIEKHDLGPTRTNIEYGIIEEGMKVKEEISEVIRRLF